MWGIKLKGFIRQVSLSYSQGYDDNGGEDNIKYNKDNDDMNNKDNNDYFFFKIISCHIFSEPRAQAEMNDPRYLCHHSLWIELVVSKETTF